MDMKFLKLLYAGLIFNIATALHVNENSGNDSNWTTNNCMQDKIVPLHYNVNVIPHMEDYFISEFNVSIRIHCTIQNISLYTYIIPNKAALSNNNGSIYIPKHQYSDPYLALIFDDLLLPGLYTLWLLLMPVLPVIARYSGRRNVCLIEPPTLKPTFNISVKHHQKYQALSHMPIREQSRDEDGMIWSHFDTTPRMPACMVIIAVLDFAHLSNANKTVSVWSRPSLTLQIKFMQYIAEKIMQHLVQYMKMTEMKLKMDYVVFLDLPFKAISVWNIIIFEEIYVYCDVGMDSTFCERNVATIVANEISRQWFGNLIYSSGPSENWIIEGFTTFLEAYIVDKFFEDWRMTDLSIVRRLQSSLYKDTGRLVPLRSTGNPKFDFADFYYGKAPAILRMLQHIITDEVFRAGIVIFLQTHQYCEVATDDLWSAMQTALGESNVSHKDFTIKEVMDTWTLHRSYPLVNVIRNYETGETIISQKHFYSQQNEQDNNIFDQKWWIPVNFATQTNPNFTSTLPTHWLRPQDQNINLQINPNDWIILNLQQIGYYRVTYDPTNWQRIASYLNSKNYWKVHVLNRAQLIDDAFNLMLETQLDFFIFLNLTRYLLRESDYIAFYPMFRMLPKLAKYFILPESETIKPYMERICNSLLEKVGYKENPNEDDFTKLKRIGAIYCACIVGNPVAKRMAAIRLDEHFMVPYYETLFLEGHGWAYCSGLMVANMTLWNRVLNLYIRFNDLILLDNLACSEDPHIIMNYLNSKTIQTMSNYPAMQVRVRTLVLTFVIEKHAWNDLVLDYILQNLTKLTTTILPTVEALKRIILNIVSRKQLNKVHEFARKEFKNSNPENLNIIERLLHARLVKLQRMINSFPKYFMIEECPT